MPESSSRWIRWGFNAFTSAPNLSYCPSFLSIPGFIHPAPGYVSALFQAMSFQSGPFLHPLKGVERLL